MQYVIYVNSMLKTEGFDYSLDKEGNPDFRKGLNLSTISIFSYKEGRLIKRTDITVPKTQLIPDTKIDVENSNKKETIFILEAFK